MTDPATRRAAGASEAPPTETERKWSAEDAEHAALQRLRALLSAGRRDRWSEARLLEFPRLYRLACSVLARLEAEGARPRATDEMRRLVGLAQVELFRGRGAALAAGPRGLRGALAAARHMLLVRSPRAIRAEWRLLATTFAAVYGLALVAWVAVGRDLDLSYSLLDADTVETQIEQLEATAEGEPFRGNFTFGMAQSPRTSAWIMVHNMVVGVYFFGAALLPPLYLLLLSKNALMLGTYTAVAGHWGQAGAISSILWCHGVLEIQAIVLAGTAGLVLARAALFPGHRTRRIALAESAPRALELLLPTFAMLFVAGLIEGFVSPHAPPAVRLAVAVTSGILLLTWALASGRGRTTVR